jgi:glutamate formiminotransferase
MRCASVGGILECVINVSEGRDQRVVDAIADAGRACLLDVHSDRHHHRSVVTLAGDGLEEAARAVATEAVRRLDVRLHTGVHPRLGVVDVVPFVPLDASTPVDALAARDRFARWAADELGVPCFLYGPERSLPEVRRAAFTGLLPDVGPPTAHPTAGAVCVGARQVLVAYNVWLAGGPGEARRVAAAVRDPHVRALGLDLGGRAQVSMNLLDPVILGPDQAYDAVAALSEVTGAELVGLVPAAVLDRVPAQRWAELDLDPSRTIEARLAR